MRKASQTPIAFCPYCQTKVSCWGRYKTVIVDRTTHGYRYPRFETFCQQCDNLIWLESFHEVNHTHFRRAEMWSLGEASPQSISLENELENV